MKSSSRYFLVLAVLSALSVTCRNNLDSLNISGPAPVVGIHHQQGAYSFTNADYLNEGADSVRELGADAIGIFMGPEYELYYPGVGGSPESLVELAKTEAYRKLFDSPFRTFSITAYAFANGLDSKWRDGIRSYDLEAAHEEIKELCEYLLAEYSGRQITFIIKNWEGDWHLLGSYDKEKTPGNREIIALTKWLNARGRAVREARSSMENASNSVNIYYCVEFNLVEKAYRGGKTVLTEVVPHVKADLYSYSCWDVLSRPWLFHTMLDFIKKYAPDSDAFGARNVMIGEIGYDAEFEDEGRRMDEASRIFSRWGVPFYFVWQIYDNECEERRFHPSSLMERKNMNCRGFGLIDPIGRKKPGWYYLKNLFDE